MFLKCQHTGSTKYNRKMVQVLLAMGNLKIELFLG